MNLKSINWFGLVAGVLLLVIVLLSVVYAFAWWHISVGEGAVEANISPLNYNATWMGSRIVIPLALFLNVISILSFLASGIALIIYSLMPDRSFSRHLLGFAYKKPLITLILFVIGLVATTYIVNTFASSMVPGANVVIPVMGSTTIRFGIGGVVLEAPITAGFTWVFWLAIIAAALCIVARFYHKRIVRMPLPVAKV